MLEFFRGEDITILRKTFEENYDSYGNAISEYEEIETTAVVGFRNSTTVSEIKKNAFRTDLRLIFKEGTVIFPEDSFIVRGEIFVKDGESLQPNKNLFKTKFLPAPVIVNIRKLKGNTLQEENEQEGVIENG